MTLRGLPTRPVLATSTDRIVRDFYVPALRASVGYDRGVGYFTSAWLRLAAEGLAALAASGGHARIVASPVLEASDWAALKRGVEAQADPRLLDALRRPLGELADSLATDTLVAIAWMIADGLLEFKLALPVDDLDGDFHDKFGVFRDSAGDEVAFHGSQNDSAKAFRNYESIDVFYSWLDAREAERVRLHGDRFKRIWANTEPNLVVVDLPESIRHELVEYAQRGERPYRLPTALLESRKWRHQQEALDRFLACGHGVLEMATGTGKTRTALAILNHLQREQRINTAVVAAFGTDLLDQWYQQLRAHTGLLVFRVYGEHKELLSFLNDPDGSLLLISRQALADATRRLPATVTARALLICDEVHGMGSPALVAALAGQLQGFGHRLGLSATPEREYDSIGNDFIEREIGPVIFEFRLEQAIERGILCEFDYVPLPYVFTDEDRQAIKRVIARYHALKARGEAPPIESLYQELARVRKLCVTKVPVFREYLRTNPDILRRCLIFVETAEYGELVQEVVLASTGNYHTYYGDDDRENLRRFAHGDLDCLITCHRISEGIDIQSVNHVIIFSAARAQLETIQRLGRCLRVDPANPDKRAVVVDFVRASDDNEPALPEQDADRQRCVWLSGLAALRRTSG